MGNGFCCHASGPFLQDLKRRAVAQGGVLADVVVVVDVAQGLVQKVLLAPDLEDAEAMSALTPWLRTPLRPGVYHVLVPAQHLLDTAAAPLLPSASSKCHRDTK